jgi:hypothetical protein
VQFFSDDGHFFTKWTAPNRISLAAINSNSGQILLSSGSKLFYLYAKSDEILLSNQLECANEIACLDISPLGAVFHPNA